MKVKHQDNRKYKIYYMGIRSDKTKLFNLKYFLKKLFKMLHLLFVLNTHMRIHNKKLKDIKKKIMIIDKLIMERIFYLERGVIIYE